MVSCPGIDRKVLGKRSYPKFELSWSKWRVTSHQEFRMMSQWAHLGLLDSQKQMFVERKGLLAPYYWHRRVLSQVRDLGAFAETRGAHRCRHREFGAVRMRLVLLRGRLGTRECWHGWQAPYWDVRGFQLKRRWSRAKSAFMVSSMSRPGG